MGMCIYRLDVSMKGIWTRLFFFNFNFNFNLFCGQKVVSCYMERQKSSLTCFVVKKQENIHELIYVKYHCITNV